MHLQGVFFVNFIGSLWWINVMKSAFQVVGYVGYVLYPYCPRSKLACSSHNG